MVDQDAVIVPAQAKASFAVRFEALKWWLKRAAELATVGVFLLGAAQWRQTARLVEADAARTAAELAPRFSLEPQTALPAGPWLWPSVVVTNKGTTSFDLDASMSMTINGAPVDPAPAGQLQFLPDEKRVIWVRQKIGDAKPSEMRAGASLNLCVRVKAENDFGSVPVVRGYSTPPEGLAVAQDGTLVANWVPAHCDP